MNIEILSWSCALVLWYLNHTAIHDIEIYIELLILTVQVELQMKYT